MGEENKIVKGNLEDVTSIKDKLQQVSNEIDSIKNNFSKGAEELARIQKMLKIGDFEDMNKIVQKFENQISESERKRAEAAEGAKKYSDELEKEKERLIKLWDAYKNQEEELSTTEKKLSEYEDRVRETESSKKQLEEDLTARINTLTQKLEKYETEAGKYEDFKTRCEEFDGIRNQLEEEIRGLRSKSTQKDDMVTSLQKQVNDLQEYQNYSEYKEKYEAITAEYEKEKERLTKLYHLYEETDAENKKLKEECQSWQQWFNSNKGVFDKIFSAPPAKNKPEPPTEITPEPEGKKKRKKLLGKK